METKKILDKNGLEYYTGKIKQQIPKKTSDLTNDSNFIDNTYHDSSKQDTLVSGTNIKTINNTSILGSGNINIETKAYIDNSLSSDSTTHGASVHAVNVGLAEKISSDGSVEKIVKSDTEPTGTEATIWIEPSDFKSTETNILKDTLEGADLDKAPTVHAVKQAIDNVENIDYDSIPSQGRIEYVGNDYTIPTGYTKSEIPYDLNGLGNMVNRLDDQMNYPAEGEEQIIGYWINSKPIYRKVIFINAFPNTATGNYAHGIDNLDIVIRMYGYGLRSADGFIFNLPFVNYIDLGYSIGLGISGKNIQLFCGTDRSNVSGYIIMEYTKTTDNIIRLSEVK